MHKRNLSLHKDAWVVQKAERVVYQQQDGRCKFLTSTLHFSPCALKDVSSFVKEHHYSHSHPGGVDYAFRCVDGNGTLVGACLYGHIAGNPAAAQAIKDVTDVNCYRELMRLVLLDAAPKNSESAFIGWTLRWLRKNVPSLAAVVSFADPHYGHVGTVYQASNWLYVGLQKTPRPRIFIDGIEKHPKSCYNLYGTSSIPKLKALGLQVTLEERIPKHKYVYPFSPYTRDDIRWPLIIPFPTKKLRI